MLGHVVARNPASALAKSAVGLRLRRGPIALGNALGSSLAGASTSGGAGYDYSNAPDQSAAETARLDRYQSAAQANDDGYFPSRSVQSGQTFSDAYGSVNSFDPTADASGSRLRLSTGSNDDPRVLELESRIKRLTAIEQDARALVNASSAAAQANTDLQQQAFRRMEIEQMNASAADAGAGYEGSLAAGRASMNSYWGSAQDGAVADGSAGSYMLATGMKALGNVGYGLADMAEAMVNDPGSTLVGVRNGVVNFGPDAFNGLVNTAKTSLSGYSLLAESSGLIPEGTLAGFRQSDPYNITTLLPSQNQAQAGGSLLVNLAAGGLGGVKFGGQAEAVWLDSTGIRQSQQSISYAKKGGYTLDDIARGFAENPDHPDLIIDAVRMRDGGLTSLDNSRPAVLNAQGGGQIQVRVRGYDDPLSAGEVRRFTAKQDGELRVPSTWGEAVDYRIWKQGDQFMNQFPNGTTLAPKVTGAPANSFWSQFNQYPWMR